MLKNAAPRAYKDPTLNKLVQEKANWNRQVSLLINDIIHFKKSMNGWPSKFYKERSRITQPMPVDLSGILGKLTGEFQEIANQGNSIIQEQANFAKTRVKNKSEQALSNLEKNRGPDTEAKPPTAPKTDLSQQLGKGLASVQATELVKLASDLETKYQLETLASNPFSRFITKLFSPKFGFGEGARIRRLRMTMLDNCVKSYKELKKLQKEIVKSSKASIISSHKMMTTVWNYWNAVNRLFSTYKAIKPDAVIDEGGQIADPELEKEKAVEEGREPAETQEPTVIPSGNPAVSKIQDYRAASNYLGAIVQSSAFRELNSLIETILAAPKDKRFDVLQKSNIDVVYDRALQEINTELGSNGRNFMQVVEQLKNKPVVAKEAQVQRWLGKTRHQILPGGTSGQRLEIYQLISQIRNDLNAVMNLLEKGFDQEKLTEAIIQVNREMTTLRTMMRSLYYSEKPGEVSSPFM